MRQTVVGVFNRYAAAQSAAQLLKQQGIDDDHIHLTAAEAGAEAGAAGEHHEGLLARIKHFFSDTLDDDNDFEVSAYSEAVRRGGAVVKVDVEDEPRLEMAREALQSAGAVDIDEQVASWRADGWSAPEPAAAAGSASALDTAATGTAAQGQQVLPVIREELEVGKRSVKAGGVRVYARPVEERVSESVQLREERAVVDRHPVDRPATEAELNALGERTIEVTESVERPVVQKTARVVEEVTVGKDVRQKEATIEDTLRHTEVQVDRLGGDQRARAYDDLRDEYRSDFGTRYGSTAGARFEDYEPAYRYGHTLAGDSRYRGRSWEQFESDAQRDWTAANPDSPWERVKAAVRHGWERVKD